MCGWIRRAGSPGDVEIVRLSFKLQAGLRFGLEHEVEYGGVGHLLGRGNHPVGACHAHGALYQWWPVNIYLEDSRAPVTGRVDVRRMYSFNRVGEMVVRPLGLTKTWTS